MKYIRKLMATGLALIFLISLVIGMGVMFSVRNVNVTYISYSGNSDEAYTQTRTNLNKLKGSGLLFIKDKDVYGKVSDSKLLVIESYQKKMPCTVNIVVRERVECYTVRTEGGFDIYDEDGKLIKSTSDDEAPMNGVDGCPNIAVNAGAEQMESIAGVCSEFKKNFGDLRRLVESVTADNAAALPVLKIKLRSGLTILVYDWSNDTAEKLAVSHEKYETLDDMQRTRGNITVIGGRVNTPPTANYK